MPFKRTFVVLLIFLTGCGGESTCHTPYSDGPLLPFPNSFCFHATSEGMKVPEYAIPAGVDVDSLSQANGFSAVTPVVFKVGGKVQLKSFSGYASSITPGSPILILNESLTHRVPFEVWQDDRGDFLVLYPLENYRFEERYFVIVKNNLLYDNGSRYDSGLSEKQIFVKDEYYRVVEELGIEPSDVEAIWDFKVRSRENEAFFRRLTNEALQYKDELKLKEIRHLPPYQEGVKERVRITFEVPEFLNEGKRLSHPLKPTGTSRLVFLLKVPFFSASDKVIPFVLFGHGLSAVKETMDQVAPELCSTGFFVGGVDASFHGERVEYTGSLIEFFMKLDPSFSGVFKDAMLETLLYEWMLLNYVKDHPEEIFGVKKPVETFYIGQSMGSFLGTALINATNDVKAAVLNVGGCCISRSVTGYAMNQLVSSQLLRSMSKDELAGFYGLSQTIMDPMEPASYAPYLKENVSALILQEAIDDGIVPNSTTETLARAGGLVLFSPYVREVPGLEVSGVGSGQSSRWGVYQFEVGSNIFYDIISPHIVLMAEEPAIQARDLFLTFLDSDPSNDGLLYDICSGPCFVK